MRRIVLHLKTKHDVNGNPRRLFLLLNSNRLGTVTSVINEGYGGTSKLPKGSASFAFVSIEVPISEYKDWIKWAKSQDCYVE